MQFLHTTEASGNVTLQDTQGQREQAGSLVNFRFKIPGYSMVQLLANLDKTLARFRSLSDNQFS